MEVGDITQLVRIIQESNEEDAIKAVRLYGNQRESRGINSGWAKCRQLMRYALKNRNRRLRKEILDFDEHSGMLSLVSFTKYFAYVEDVIKALHNKGSLEVKLACGEISAASYQALGNLKIDRRLLFSKKD